MDENLLAEIEAGLVTGPRLVELFRGLKFEIYLLKTKLDQLSRELEEHDRAECRW